MRRSRFIGVLALASCLSAMVMGCSGNGSGSAESPSVNGQGPLYLSAATVCADLNDNYACDANEPSALTDDSGRYSIKMDPQSVGNHRLVLVANSASKFSNTGDAPKGRFMMASEKGKTGEISIFTTMLSLQTAYAEKDIKGMFGITEQTPLAEGAGGKGEIATFAKYLTDTYAGFYKASGTNSNMTPLKQALDAVFNILHNATSISELVAKMERNDPIPPNNAATTTTRVGEELFQNLPIDAGTMNFGVGYDEIRKEVVSGAYCLKTPQVDLVPQPTPSENSKSYVFKLVKSEKDIKELLNVGGKLDLGTMPVQGSIEGRFIDTFNSDTEAVYAMIKAEYRLTGYNLSGMELNPIYLVADSSKASYISNYEAFKAACGDRYLAQVSSGGAYYGLLKITSSTSMSNKDLSVNLEGKYGNTGVTVKVSGDLKSNIQSNLSNTNIEITVGSRGVDPQYLGLQNAKDQLIDNLDDFFNAADQFFTAIENPSNVCHDDNQAYKKCAYTATFADYATISGGIPRNQTQRDNLNYTNKIIGQYQDYRNLEASIMDMIVNQDFYNWGPTQSPDALFDEYNRILQGEAIMDSALNKCATDFLGCAKNTDTDDLKSFTQIKLGLPMPKLAKPRTCEDIQRMFGQKDTDLATLYFEGDNTKTYKVACKKMDTTQPETYLLIPNTSGSTSTLLYNMAKNIDTDGSEVASIYKRILVNVNLNDLEIINDQQSYVTTDADSTADFDQARLGTAVDCNASVDPAKTNINLEGTPFKFDPGLSYSTTTHPSTKYSFINTAMTWNEANDYAVSNGAHLVVIDSLAEFNVVKELAKTSPGGTKNVWIGLTRSDLTQPTQYQQFQWVTNKNNLTGKEVADYFVSSEPNNSGGHEACVHLWGTYEYKLNDIVCTTKMPFIIEKEYTEVEGTATIGTKSIDATVKGSSQEVCSQIAPKDGYIRLVWE